VWHAKFVTPPQVMSGLESASHIIVSENWARSGDFYPEVSQSGSASWVTVLLIDGLAPSIRGLSFLLFDK
jgi:hypothetical protein